MNTTAPAGADSPPRRPLHLMADDIVRGTGPAANILSRILPDPGRPTVTVAAFGSSV